MKPQLVAIVGGQATGTNDARGASAPASPTPPTTSAKPVEDVNFSFDLPESITVKEACKFLEQHGVFHYKLVSNGTAVKVGDVTYYASKQTVCRDGHRKYARTGLEFFLEVLRQSGLAR